MTISDPRPSPAQLATPAAKARAARRMAGLMAPVELGTWRFRPAYTQAIRQSGMTPHPRLLALVIGTYANGETGVIRDDRQPGLHRLATDTGLTVGQVLIALRVLESRGWVSTAEPAPGRTTLQPHVPRHAIATLRAARTASAKTEQPTP